MRARWVKDASFVSVRTVGWTVVARWLPQSYLLVITIGVPTSNSDDALSVLVRKLDPDAKDTWVTQVFRCRDRYGFGHPDEPLYKREYSCLEAAKSGHSEIVEALRAGKHRGALLGYTPDQVMRISWLRAAEWLSWPAFISQPILPILYLYWDWSTVLAWVAIANLLWRFVRYRFVNYTLATVGCLVVRLKWLVILLFASYYLWHRELWLAGLSVASPLIAMMLVTLSTGKIGLIQEQFVRLLMLDSDIEALAKTESEVAVVADT